MPNQNPQHLEKPVIEISLQRGPKREIQRASQRAGQPEMPAPTAIISREAISRMSIGERRAVAQDIQYLLNTGDPVYYDFSFIGAQKWVEVKDIFHANLLHWNNPNKKELSIICRKLHVNVGTIYSTIKRAHDLRGFDMRGESNYLNGFKSYFELLEGASWKELNNIFERDFIWYVFRNNSFNITDTSKAMDVHYQNLLRKIRTKIKKIGE